MGQEEGGGQDARATWTGHPARMTLVRECAELQRMSHSPRMGNAGKMPAPREPGILPG